MLKELTFTNYRCFQEHIIPLDANSIVVGRNNAGKSTAIEGLRILSVFTERYPNLNFREVPPWIDIPLRNRGMHADLSKLSLSWENLFHQYGNPPANVVGKFSDGTCLTVHLGPEESVHAVVNTPSGQTVQTKGQARNTPLHPVFILPQVMPFQREETVLGEDYVRANLSSYLAPQHFRNQLKLYYSQYFEEFKNLVEDTWPGLQIIELRGVNALPGEDICLLVRDGDFVAEVAWMGHGLQMWLQTMWFVARTPRNATVVLDEPDVYMHPDLQRKLVRFLRGRFKQVIIATHSTEILSETDAKNVLVLDRQQRHSKFATDLPAVQRLLGDIGSAQNLALTRLWTARKLILVEGDDIPFLKRFHELLYPNSLASLSDLPTMPLGGWSGWPYAVGSSMLLRNAGGEDILTYCVLDSDYHTPAQIQARQNEATAKNVQLHIWGKKEIENYLVQDSVIYRVIMERLPIGQSAPSLLSVSERLDEWCEELRNETTDCFAQEFHNDDRRGGLALANTKARTLVEDAWQTRIQRIGVVSGKKLLSGMSAWAQENFKVSFGANTLLAELRESELCEEIRSLIQKIELGDTI